MARRKRALFWLAGVAGLGVFATRWPFRSHELFSWDSANFALAMADIDIAAHRPHPPGYIGYVLAARALDVILRDPNLSLVVWNILVTVLATLVLIRFAWEIADDQRQLTTAAATALIFATSPLVWFYGEVAEIYPSELLVTLLVAFTAWRTIQGRDRQIYWCAGSLAIATMFKVSSAVMMLPLAVYAWTRVAPAHRWKSAALLVVLLGMVGAIFLTLQPDLATVTWRQLVASTTDTRLVGGDTKVLKALNRNIRDVLTAAVSGLGVVGAFTLAFMAVFARRLPAGLDRRVALLWALPWVLIVLVVHVAKPGYILPLVPLAVLIIAAGLVRLRRPIFVVLMSLLAVTNVLQFAWLAPPSYAAVEGGKTYRNKSIRARALSDLQAITDPTAFAIRLSDRRVTQLRDLIARTCPQGNPIIVARSEEVDWRRVMWFFPAASSIRIDRNTVVSIATNTQPEPVPPSGVLLATDCPVIWLHAEHDAPGPLTPRDAVPVPGLGGMTAAGAVFVTPAAIRATPR